MHRFTFILAIAAATFSASDWSVPAAHADQAPRARQTVLRQPCKGPACGPYAPCGARCRVACPDGYSCHPLYGAYGPYGGVGYWGGYTYSGWGLGR
jgi:hypothetical protein